MAKHTSSQFNMELEEVRSEVLKMGGLVEEQINTTLAALAKTDETSLEAVVEGDTAVNEMEVGISEKCLVIIARRQPAAGDLRLVLAVSRVIVDLERIGDETKKIAQTAVRLIRQHHFHSGRFHSVTNILTIARDMLRRSLDAFARLDTEAILELRPKDILIDKECEDHLRVMITHMMESPRTISESIDLLFIDKAMERIGDHAINISEHVIYLAKGIDIRHADEEEIKRAAESSAGESEDDADSEQNPSA